MVMRLSTLLIVMSGWAPMLDAQTLNIGDPAPALQISDWIQGEPVDLAKGKGQKVYLIEFWGTFCLPCLDTIPHLTRLQDQYRDQLVVVGVSDEPREVIVPFMKKLGDKMKYIIASDAAEAVTTPQGLIRVGKTTQAYRYASGQDGIPTAFIVSKDGRIAWIGHPLAGMDAVLEAVIGGTYDIDKAREESLANAAFSREHEMILLMSLQNGQWNKVLEVGKKVADPACKMSREFRTRILDSIAWTILTDERSDKIFFQEALQIARTAYETSEGKDVSVMETLAKALFVNDQVSEAIRYQRQAVEQATGVQKIEMQKTLDEYQKPIPQTSEPSG